MSANADGNRKFTLFLAALMLGVAIVAARGAMGALSDLALDEALNKRGVNVPGTLVKIEKADVKQRYTIGTFRYAAGGREVESRQALPLSWSERPAPVQIEVRHLPDRPEVVRPAELSELPQIPRAKVEALMKSLGALVLLGAAIYQWRKAGREKSAA